MRLCFLSDAKAEHTRRWTKYFALKGHTVKLITWNAELLPDYDPVRVEVVRKRRLRRALLSRALNLPSLLLSVRKAIREFRPHVVHAHSAEAYAWMAAMSGFHPYIVTPWGTDLLIEAKRSTWIRRLNRCALRGADLVTCDAIHMRRELIDLGVPSSRVRLVMFGTEVERFRPDPERRSAQRRRHNLGDAPIVISTRTLTPLHDIPTFARAMPLIVEKLPEVRFIIAGDGSSRAEILQLVESLGMAGRIHFTGHLTEDEMAAWLDAADVYVSTSLTDAGLAGSTAEAMATGLPVVITDNADNRDWVREGEMGFLIPNGDATALAARVVDLLRDDGLRQRFGHLNRKAIVDRNNYRTQMDLVERLYQTLAGL